MRENNLIGNKYIPSIYKMSSVEQRFELLRGLIDTDGTIDKRGICEFYNTNEILIDDVLWLIRSLGFKARKKFKCFSNRWGSKEKTDTKIWVVRFHPSDIRVCNFERKYSRQRKVKREQEIKLRYLKSVTPVKSIPVKCIEVDSPDSLFVVGNSLLLTHNTEALVLRTLHGMIYQHYPQGAVYLFPTRDDVKDFSKARFDPLIAGNGCISNHVQNTDATNIKQIGRAFLYLRGARITKNISGAKKSSSQLKSIPVDRVVFDERDEMDDSMVELARERVSHSDVQEIISLGTPTIPDYGIDKMYQESDQRVWMIRCEKCNKFTCLELEFPTCIMRRPDGEAYRGCVHCQEEIFPHNGQWVPQYPGREKVGWWISQLNSLYVKPGYILDLYEDPPNGDLSEVMNSKLGRAYIPAENRLTSAEVYACCGKDPMLMKHDGPCGMGVDVGRELHVTIGYRTSRRNVKIIYIGRVSSFTDLHDLGKRYGVRSSVIDLKPETRKVRDFQTSEPYSIFGCDYVETRTGMTAWDEKERVIKCNRTEICDMSHDLVTEPGRLELPRRNTEIDQYVREMCNIAKVLEEDMDTGNRVYRYKKLGPDHYRHSTNYLLLACDRIGSVNDSKLIGLYYDRRRRRNFMTA